MTADTLTVETMLAAREEMASVARARRIEVFDRLQVSHALLDAHRLVVMVHPERAEEGHAFAEQLATVIPCRLSVSGIAARDALYVIRGDDVPLSLFLRTAAGVAP